MRSVRANLFALVAIACAVLANANPAVRLVSRTSLSFRDPRPDSILSEAPAPLDRVPSRALTLSSPRPQEHALDGDSPLLAALGATMNPDGTLSGPGSKAGGPPPRQQLEMVHGWRAFRKIFGKSRAHTQLDATSRKMGKRLGSSGVVKPSDATTKLGSGPELAEYVTARKRVFSLGLDPDVERTAAEWFESLGYVSLHGDRHFAKGYWGGVVSEMDARLAVSVCTGASDVSLVSGYDFANWLPVPSVFDALALDFPDAKFVLFETPVEVFVKRAKAKAEEARALGAKCGCVSARVGGPIPTSRSTSSSCGDATHHVCDAYPCVYEKAFGTADFDETVWREAYVAHIAAVKTAIPADRLLIVPMVGGHSPVSVARALGEFAGITNAPDAFASRHPFEPRAMSIRGENRWSLFLYLGVAVLGTAVLFAPNPYARRSTSASSGYAEFER